MTRPWLVLLPWLLGCAYAPRVEATERGLATYYTVQSCQQEGTSGIRTASGERYDETAFSCALPHRRFGYLYRVCRSDRTRSCIVARHNDVGPGRRARARGVVIDLTPAAFDALGGTRGCGRRGCWGELSVSVERLP